jgi:hypothetical protein
VSQGLLFPQIPRLLLQLYFPLVPQVIYTMNAGYLMERTQDDSFCEKIMAGHTVVLLLPNGDKRSMRLEENRSAGNHPF